MEFVLSEFNFRINNQYKVQIFTTQGNEDLRQELVSSELNLDPLHSGIYFVQLSNNGENIMN